MTHSKHLKGNSADRNVVISNVQMGIISDIPVLFGKQNSHPNFHTKVTHDNKQSIPQLLTFVLITQRTVYT